MKKILLCLVLSGIWSVGFGTNFTIVNAGTFPTFSFSPATTTITKNDVVTFTLAISHDAVEVSQATWDANGITPKIGFAVAFGGGTVLGSSLSVGTHYFVCENHGTSGMKGKIIVQSLAGIEDHKTQNDILVYPCPAKEDITIQFDTSTSNVVEIRLFNLQGKLVDLLLPKTEAPGLFLRTFSLNKITVPGVYFVQIAVGDNTSIRKVVIL